MNLAGRARRAGGSRALLLLLGAALLLAALWGAVLHSIDAERAADMAAETAKNDNLALAHAERTARALQVYDLALRFLADDYLRQGAPRDLKQRLAAVQVDQRHVLSLTLIDAAGNNVATIASGGGGNLGDRDYFRAHAEDPSDSLRVGQPLLGRASGKWGVPLTRRISRADGSFAGVVYLSLDPVYFATVYPSNDAARHAAMALVGLDGIVRVRRNGDKVSFGEDIRNSQLFKELALAPRGHSTAVAASDGVRRAASYRQLEGSPLVVVVASSLDDVLAASRSREHVLLGAAAIGSLLVLLLAAGAAQLLKQRRNERQLSDALADLYENAPCGYHSLDADGRFLRVNATESAWLGCEPGALIGQRRVSEFFTPEGQALFKEQFPRLLAEGRVDGLEFDLVGALGGTRRISISATAVRDADGRFLMSRSVMFDISELHRTRSQLEQRNREQLAMLDNDLLGIVRLRQRRIVWANRGMQRTFGHEADTLIGQSMRLLHLSEEAFAAEGARAYPGLQGGGEYRQQLQMRRSDGQTVWIDARGVLLSPETDESLWLLADISSLKQAEAMRLHAAGLEAENRQLQEAGRLKSLFLANMSHELRTPLNAIIGFAGLIKLALARGDLQQLRSHAERIDASGRHLQQLIQDVLDYAKAEADRIGLEPQTLALAPLVHETVDLHRAAAQRKLLQLEVQVDAGIGAVRLDPLRLRQVLSNYLSNAIKFTPDGGQVVVSVVAEGPAHFRAEVRDTGIGIAVADQPRLFVAFQQLSSGSTKQHAGTGLGLALTLRLVEAMGGTVGVRSVPAEGSCFHAVLPRGLG